MMCIPLRNSATGVARSPSIGGVVPFSSIDWPQRLTAVIFVAGCPWRCHYCHNPHLQQREGHYDWREIVAFLARRQGLLDGLVISGGEPLSEPCLPDMLAEAKAMGFDVALHTAGIYPARLAKVLPLVDWIGFDVKTTPPSYAALTGRSGSAAAVARSLQLLLTSQCEFECRTTWQPDWLAEQDLLDLAQDLSERGVKHYAVQRYRSGPNLPTTASLSERAQDSLHDMFETFCYR